MFQWGRLFFRWGGFIFNRGCPMGASVLVGEGSKNIVRWGGPNAPPHYRKPCFIVIGKIVG